MNTSFDSFLRFSREHFDSTGTPTIALFVKSVTAEIIAFLSKFEIDAESFSVGIISLIVLMKKSGNVSKIILMEEIQSEMQSNLLQSILLKTN
jgi:hypothetical protein